MNATINKIPDSLKVSIVDAEATVMAMGAEIDAIEATETIQVKILDSVFDIEPRYFHESIGSFIASAFDEKAENHLVQYLKTKYAGFNGVPIHLANDELLLTEKQYKNFLAINYGRKKVEFVDFSLIADTILIR